MVSVSGDAVVLRGGSDIEALVRAAALVAANSGVPTAVIGGLAVTCRLATVHRATADVDVVAGTPEVAAGGTSVAQHLVAEGVAEHLPGDPPNRVDVAGARVEIIETAPIDPADAADIEPERARLFILAHRWALETATVCTVGVHGTAAEAVVPAAIVAMKLHSIQDRKDPEKRASDAWDLFRLLRSSLADREFLEAFATAPSGLVPLIREGIDRHFRREVARTRRSILAYGDSTWAAQTTAEALVELADDFLAFLPVE